MSIFVDINEEIQFVNTVVRLETVSTTGEILWQKIEEIDFLLFIIEFNWRVVNFSSERMTKGIDSPTGLKSPRWIEISFRLIDRVVDRESSNRSIREVELIFCNPFRASTVFNKSSQF